MQCSKKLIKLFNNQQIIPLAIINLSMGIRPRDGGQLPVAFWNKMAA